MDRSADRLNEAAKDIRRGQRCGQMTASTIGYDVTTIVTCGFNGALGGTRTPNLLIRRLCHAYPLPAHFAADLPRCYSLMRNRWQR